MRNRLAFAGSIVAFAFWSTWCGLLGAQEGGGSLPVPKPADIARAESALKSIFQSEFEQATTNEQKLALAGSLLTQGVKSKGDPAEKYALLQSATDLASTAGDLNLAFEALTAISNAFDVQPTKLKAELLVRLLKTSDSGTDRSSLLETASQLVEPALLTGDYDAAKKLATTGLTIARATSDTEHFKAFSALTKDVDEAERARSRANTGRKSLEKQPSSKSASLDVGRYRCFFEGNFAEGLLMLEQGTDQKLSALAQLELADPKNPQARLKLADDWWELAQREKGIAKKNIERHALDWYQLASAGLDGLLKAKAEKRIADATGIIPERPRSSVAMSPVAGNQPPPAGRNRPAPGGAGNKPAPPGALLAALARLNPTYFDDFTDPNSGMVTVFKADRTLQYLNGSFRVEALTNSGLHNAMPCFGQIESSAIRITARCSGKEETPRWGFVLSNPERKESMGAAIYTGSKMLLVDAGLGAPSVGPKPQQFPAPSIKQGDASNELVALIKGKYMEFYVNGEAVGTPLTVDQSLWPARFFLRVDTRKPGVIEFDDVSIWPAADLPVLRPDLVR